MSNLKCCNCSWVGMYEDLEIEDNDDDVSICPKCNSRDIAENKKEVILEANYRVYDMEILNIKP